MREQELSKKSKYISDLFSVKNNYLNTIYSSLQDKRSLIQISKEEGRLLQVLIKMNKIKTIVEIGTLSGFSSACMADALPNDGHIFTIEKNKEHAELALKNFREFNLTDKITLIHGDASEELSLLNDKAPFDMIFIDANKSGYCKYLDWAELHIKSNGLIVADNTLLFDAVFMDNPPRNISKTSILTMQSFNQRLANTEKYCSTLITTKEGITIALKLT